MACLLISVISERSMHMCTLHCGKPFVSAASVKSRTLHLRCDQCHTARRSSSTSAGATARRAAWSGCRPSPAAAPLQPAHPTPTRTSACRAALTTAAAPWSDCRTSPPAAAGAAARVAWGRCLTPPAARPRCSSAWAAAWWRCRPPRSPTAAMELRPTQAAAARAARAAAVSRPQPAAALQALRLRPRSCCLE